MKNKSILLVIALIAINGNNSAQSQTPPNNKPASTVQQATQADPGNMYVIRHHGLSNQLLSPNDFILSPSVPNNVGSEEAAESDDLCQDGAAQVKRGNLKLAQDDYNQALSLTPDSKTALYGAAECAIAAADFPRAVGYYRSAIYSNDPTRSDMVSGVGFQENGISRLMRFASVLSHSGQASEAMFVYNRATFRLDYQDSQSNGGKPHLKVLLPELSAEPTSPEQVQYKPEHLQALADTALAYEETSFGSDKEAIAHMQEAVKLYPDSPVTHYYQGHVLLRANDPGAKAAFQKAIEIGDDKTVAAAKEGIAMCR